MTDSLILKLQEPKVFDTFIQENMKLSTYKAEWKEEMGAPEYCAAKAYQAYLAEHTAAVVGSVIDKNAEKKIFINGILDRILKKLNEEKAIVKKGIGLLES